MRISLTYRDDSIELDVACRRELVKALYDASEVWGCVWGDGVYVKVLGVMADGEFWQSVTPPVVRLWGVDSESLWDRVLRVYDQCEWLSSINVRVVTAESTLLDDDSDQ